jgi:hypothetical protein
MSGKYRNYTKQEDEYIAANYYKIPAREIAAKLNRSAQSIRTRASVRGISRARGHNVKTGYAAPVNEYDGTAVVYAIMEKIVERNQWPAPKTPALDRLFAERGLA